MFEVNLECVESIEPVATSDEPQSPTESTATGSEEQERSSKNSKDAYLEAVRILLMLLDNIITDPTNLKYRSIRLENKTISEKLLSLGGCVELLKAIGFSENSTEYTLPQEVPVNHVKQYRDILAERRNAWLPPTEANEANEGKETTEQEDTSEASGAANAASVSPDTLDFIPASVPYDERIDFPIVVRSRYKLIQGLEERSDAMMQYEDPLLLAAGKAMIPLDRLNKTVKEKLKAIKEEIAKSKCYRRVPCARDLLLVELVNWFNTEFFEWVDNMPCKVCGSEESKLKRTEIDDDDIRVEIGICCGQETKFYRYNDISKLLVTRKGRCGEFANCFTFLCRCLDYEARMVYSYFDHVWSEVYSVKQERWMHVDPSENVIDAPLMYQHGWRREVFYVFAFSREDVQDVTWRYTSDHRYVIENRVLCPERDLINAVSALTRKRQRNLTEERKDILMRRTLGELIALIEDRQPTENELRGRSSGSLAWRQSRGEHKFYDIFQFTLNETDIERKQFNMRYSCAADVYECYIKDDDKITVTATHKTWQSAQFSSENLFRKVERDWKMVYLAREEETHYAEIVWKFNFSATKLRVKSFKLRFDRKTFGEGFIELYVWAADRPDGDIEGAAIFQIKAQLSGGKGDVAWQHTQLFRQTLNSKEYPFDLQVELA